MNTHQMNLFVYVVKYFAVHSWAGEQPADLTYDKLLDNAKSHGMTAVDYHHND